jgi:lipopolysaccharide export LptBFGC system permease protein LptF
MIKKIDLYIFKSNMVYFLSGNIGILCLFVFIDLFEKFFDANKFKIFDGFLSIFLYYLYDSTRLIEIFAPFSFALCTMFTLSKLHQSSQLVAIHSSGLSIFRIIANFVVTALFICAFLFLSQNYITPNFLQKKQLIVDSEFYNKPIENIHFKDKIEFLKEIPDVNMLKNNMLSSINVEGVIIAESKAKKLHATIFDKNGIPVAKLFAYGLTWDENNVIQLNEGFCYSHFGNKGVRSILNDKTNQIKLSTSLYNAYLAQNNPSCLSLLDLKKFTDNAEVLADFWFRIFFAAQPALMLIFSLAFVINLLYKSPVSAYFLTLGCCMFVFFLYKYLKTAMIENNLSPMFTGVIILCFSIIPLYLNKKNLPT